MKSSVFLLPSLLRVAVAAESFPYLSSVAFDDGALGAYPNQTYITAPEAISPRFNVLQSNSRCDDGLYTMISLRGDKVELKGQSPMIFDGKGNLVWMNATYGETFGLGVQTYKGEKYLTFWQGDDSVGGHGEGYYFMLDSSYQEAYRLSAGSGLPGDLHEFRITEAGTALLTIYPMKEYELSHQPGRMGNIRKGYMWDSVFQEVDMETNQVIFEWHASDHYRVDESDFPAGNAGRSKNNGYDFFHINSIDKDVAGNYLVSSRYMQGVSYIDGKTGEVLWVLGGRRNSFTDKSGGTATKFGWQHDARWNADHTGIHLFDNGARYGLKPSVEASRGVEVLLDTTTMTAEIKAEFVNPRKIISGSQGSMQVLPSGNVLLGFGYNAAWTEFSSEGEPLCDVHVGSEKTFNTGAVQTYKVNKAAWVGKPNTAPKIAVVGSEVFLSWNGATEVKKWRIQGSRGTGVDLQAVVEVEKTGFETSVRVYCEEWHLVRGLALDGSGAELGVTEVVSTDCAPGEIDNVDEDIEEWYWGDDEKTERGFQLLGIVCACVGIWELWRRRCLKGLIMLLFRKLGAAFDILVGIPESMVD